MKRKLRVEREVLRQLKTTELSDVAGGVPDTLAGHACPPDPPPRIARCEDTNWHNSCWPPPDGAQ